MVNGFSTAGADFTVAAAVASDSNGSLFTLSRDAMTVRLIFSGAGATQYGFSIEKVDATGAQLFAHAGQALTGDATLIIDLASWPGNGQPLSVDVDLGSDGSVEQTLMLSDQN